MIRDRSLLQSMCRLRFLASLVLAAAPGPALAQAPRLLFIRGADRSGGFLEANNDAQRTEQLADLNNDSAAGGNHGWKTLADTLRAEGFIVEQAMEPLEPGAPATGQTTGAPLPLDTMPLDDYDAIVFASNNAAYTAAQVDAVEAYLRGGGGAVFISDANFGSSWADASDSDQPFLDRLGLIMHQDQGTYSLVRNDGDFLAPDHPILEGVDRFDGEGVTPIEVGDPADGVHVTILARAKNQTRLNQPPFGGNQQGPSRAAGPDDAALLAATVDHGRLVGHFDRNTFFNLNGAGTNITRFDNRQLAINLFSWAAKVGFITGDYNGNGQVEQGDLDLVLENWGVDTAKAGPPPGWVNDPPVGVIEQSELDRVLTNWGSLNDPVINFSSLPEPGAAGAVAGLVPLLLRRGA